MDRKTKKQLVALWIECNEKRLAVIDNLNNGKTLGHTAEPVRREINLLVIDMYRQFQDALKEIIDGEA